MQRSASWQRPVGRWFTLAGTVYTALVVLLIVQAAAAVHTVHAEKRFKFSDASRLASTTNAIGNDTRKSSLETMLLINDKDQSKESNNSVREEAINTNYESNASNRDKGEINSNKMPAWKLAGLESASLTIEQNENADEENYLMVNSKLLRDSCPTDCKCGLITGVTCYSPDNGALLPQHFPHGIQLLTLYGYKYITDSLKELNELRELSVYDGNLTDIPALPKALTHLRIVNSNLKSLNNIETLPYLQSLNVPYNNLTDASLAGLSHLLSLDLSNNPLGKVPKLPASLAILYLKNTDLKQQPQNWDEYLPNLRHLVLTGTSFTKAPYLNFPKLEHLDLSYSSIRSLPFLSSLPSLKDVNLSRIKVTEVEQDHFKGPDKLEKLDLSFTQIKELPTKVFTNNPNLREIYMHNTNLNGIKDYTLSGLYKLEKLVLRDNQELKHVDDKSLSTLHNLKLFDISHTAIRALPSSLQKLNLTLLQAENVTLLCDCHGHWLPEYLDAVQAHTRLTGLVPVRCSDGQSRSLEELREHLYKQECLAPDIVSPAAITLRRGIGKTALLECNATGTPSPHIIWHSPDRKYYSYSKLKIEPWFSDKFKYILEHRTVINSDQEQFEIFASVQTTPVSNDSLSITDTPNESDDITNAPEMFFSPRIVPLKSGQLLIQNMSRGDVGLYRCIAVNAVASVTSTTSLWLTVDELQAFKLETLLFALACALSFLLATLIVQFIRYVMDRMGWVCCCFRGRIHKKAQQVKRLLESIESYKTQQLDRLKDNYNSQVVSIKESCYQQMERLSESYQQQCRNLQSLKDYSTQQLNTARDQYLEQINKVRDYSVGQMNKVSENYVFQRQRIRKFSAHQLFKLRETYKYQQKTLNKILENIPDLYLQNCRTGGSCNRTDSIIFDDEIHGIDAYYKLDFLSPIHCQGSNDCPGSSTDANILPMSTDGHYVEECYYTPSSTLTHLQRQHILQHHKRQLSGCSSNATSNEYYHEAVQSWASNTPVHGSPSNSPSHNATVASNKSELKHTRSWSVCGPSKMSKNSSSNKTHRRTLSANINTGDNTDLNVRQDLPRVHAGYQTQSNSKVLSFPILENKYWGPTTESPVCDTMSQSRVEIACDVENTETKDEMRRDGCDSDSSDNETTAMLSERCTDELNVQFQGSPKSKCLLIPAYIKLKPRADAHYMCQTGCSNVDQNLDLCPDCIVTMETVQSSGIGSTDNSVHTSDIGQQSLQRVGSVDKCDSDAGNIKSHSADHSTRETIVPRKSVSREGSKEYERCPLPSVIEDAEPSLSEIVHS